MDDCSLKPSTPNPHPPRPTTTVLSRLLSPTVRFPLGPNDDHLERAEARAARAAAMHRPPDTRHRSPSPDRSDHFDRDQIMELYRNCIRLAAENKINQKNTWELGLIDHLSEIIRVDSDDQNETNFQKASYTLETGVKIYSLRVDSVHAEAYKVLGAIKRGACRGDLHIEEDMTKADFSETQQNRGLLMKEAELKMVPLSTLESSFEVLNRKQFDVAFTVDPMFHQTSAMFDEAGAKGLLLNTLGVYSGCRLLFDSFEVPEKSIRYDIHNEKSEVIDLSFAKELIEQMVVCMPTKNIISSRLRHSFSQLNAQNPPVLFLTEAEKNVLQDVAPENMLTDGEISDDFEKRCFDHDDYTSAIGDLANSMDLKLTTNQEENDNCTFEKFDVDKELRKLSGLLSLGLDFNSKSNTWAGSDHWKYQKTKGVVKKFTDRKLDVLNINYTESLDREMLDIFSPPISPRSLLLPLNRVVSNTKLPEDCLYNPESLVRLFLRPGLMFLGRKGRNFSDEPLHCDPPTLWHNGIATNDSTIFGDDYSDASHHDDLVSQPHEVFKSDIQYDKVSKQICVHALKANLWSHIKGSIQFPETGCDDARASFRQVLCRFQNDGTESSFMDIAPHLFFVCLLHLANEHGLSICGSPGLDEVDIRIPRSALVN